MIPSHAPLRFGALHIDKPTVNEELGEAHAQRLERSLEEVQTGHPFTEYEVPYALAEKMHSGEVESFLGKASRLSEREVRKINLSTIDLLEQQGFDLNVTAGSKDVGGDTFKTVTLGLTDADGNTVEQAEIRAKDLEPHSINRFAMTALKKMAQRLIKAEGMIGEYTPPEVPTRRGSCF